MNLDLVGKYIVPIPRGLNVEFDMSYNNHTFRRVSYSDRLSTGSNPGYVSSTETNTNVEYFFVEQPTDRIDFEDITTVNVTIELAGGLCNSFLGEAEVWFTRIPECGTGFKMVRNLTAFSNTISLPAHRFEYSFGAMKTKLPTFDREVAEYLVRARNDTGELELTNHTSSETVKYARFEYHPFPYVTLSLSNTAAGCSYSYPKIESMYLSNATIRIYETYSLFNPFVPTCTNIQGTVYVTNNLGEDVPDVPLLSVCRETCALEVTSDPIYNTTNATVCTGDVADNTTTTIACPAGGVISHVEYASYGALSSGTCSAGYSNSVCKSSRTGAVVLRACVGKANCTINVKPATFGGNPCGANATNYFTAKVICNVTTLVGYQNARVLLPLQVGYPNHISPYLKTLVVRMQVAGYIKEFVEVCPLMFHRDVRLPFKWYLNRPPVCL